VVAGRRAPLGPAITAGEPSLRPSWRPRLIRLISTAVVAGLLIVELILAGPSLANAVHGLATASSGWLLIGAAATALSMLAFGVVRQRTLRAAGIRVPLRDTVAVSYAAGAINTTLPAGGVFSTAYAYRYLRRWGASSAVATWCMAITGLLATATLAVVGLMGILLSDGAHDSALESAVEIAASGAGIAAIVYLTRRPDRLTDAAGAALRLVNRLRHRPADAGRHRLDTLGADLRLIHPSPGDWTASLSSSLLNWLLDLGCLYACAAAVGVHVSLAALLLTYTAGMATASVSPIPAGLGMVEAALVLGLTSAGAVGSAALAAVILYRLLSTGSVVVVGWIAVAVQRLRSPAARLVAGQ